MAASSNTPGNAPAVKTKKEFTPEQKKQFTLLGVIGVLALGAVAANWGSITGGGSTTPTASAPETTTPVTGSAPEAPPSTDGIAPNPEGGAPSDGAAPVSAPAGTTVAYAGVNRSREDPFTPFVILPPVPTAEPTPIPPIELPSTQSLESIVIPQASPRLTEAQERPLILPSVVIPRMSTEVKAPRDAFPPARTSGTGAQSNTDPEPSYDKRLSGVVIANGVRALLEINGLERKSYVVQPGDTVEGVTILDIQRFDEGGRTITRMLIRENGQTRFVDLKAAPQPAGGPEGVGGIPGGRP